MNALQIREKQQERKSIEYDPMTSKIAAALYAAVLTAIPFAVNAGSPTHVKTGGPNSFSLTGSMNVTRYGHRTILLGNGQVLAVTPATPRARIPPSSTILQLENGL
jgi:hypothetical protein